MNRLIGIACPACKQPITAQGDLLDDAAMCMQCGAVLWIDDSYPGGGGMIRVIDEQELARFDADVKRSIARALDELEGDGERLQ